MMNNDTYDKIIIGAGLYGLYAADFCGKKGERVLVLERDGGAFRRATYINQARVHMGYHYPRSLSTAKKSAGYFKRFCEEYDFCIHRDFAQVYATSSRFSWTDAEQFMLFCETAGIPCEEVPVSRYFRQDMCDGAFLTREYTYDAAELARYYTDRIADMPNVSIEYGSRIEDILCDEAHNCFVITLAGGRKLEGAFLLNATYASTNQVLNMVRGAEHKEFDLKYELCEIILTEPSEELKNVGITVMDGPFFSIMPFGKTGFHSLTSVSFTPHITSYENTPVFRCQERAGKDVCSRQDLGNCSECEYRLDSAWPYMDHLARKYMLPQYDYKYVRSLFSMKPILKASEVDDSRPTAIRVNHRSPDMVSVLSGKINTVYDMEEYL